MRRGRAPGAVGGLLLEDVVLPFRLHDLIVPSENVVIGFHNVSQRYGEMASILTKQNPSYGRHGQVNQKQLVELSRRGLAEGGGGEDLVPGTPARTFGGKIWR